MTENIMAHRILAFGPFRLHGDTVLMSLIITGLLLGLAYAATRRMKVIPGPLQGLVEILVEFLEKMAAENIGAHGRIYLPFFATLFIFIFFANMLGLIPGLKSPTADVNFTFGLAVAVMLAMQYASIRTHGFIGWLTHFFRPNFLFFVIHLLEMVTRPLTLALRLFGNIFAGEVLIIILYSLAPVVVPTLWLALSVVIGVIQAYIFTVLSMAYTGMAVEE
ncbi:MAG: F0F1 ATP synthase subunit A [Bacteroidota bacterium]